MCGRTACALAPDDLVKACTYTDKGGKKKQPQWKDAPGGQSYTMSYNIAPTAHCPVLLSGSQLSSDLSERVLMPMKWGLTPAWHKDDPYKVPFETNNCRVEGMLEKKTYKVPLNKGHRCVILMDGFFEWKTSKEGKQPYFFHFPQSPGFSFSNIINLSVKMEVKTETLNYDSSVTSSAKRLKKENGIKEEVQEQSFLEDAAEIKTDCVSNHEQNDAMAKINCSNGGTLCDSSSPTDSSDKRGKRSHSDTKEPTDFLDSLKSCEEQAWSGHRLLTVAGVYDVWQAKPNSAPLYSYSVITVPASEEFSWCHHRMPAILTSEQEVDQWLDTASIPLKEAASLIRPTKGLSYYPVTKAMGNSRYKEADSVAPITFCNPKPSPSSTLMMNWLKKGAAQKK